MDESDSDLGFGLLIRYLPFLFFFFFYLFHFLGYALISGSGGGYYSKNWNYYNKERSRWDFLVGR